MKQLLNQLRYFISICTYLWEILVRKLLFYELWPIQINRNPTL